MGLKIGKSPRIVSKPGVEAIRLGRMPHVDKAPLPRAIDHANEYADKIAKRLHLQAPALKKP